MLHYSDGEALLWSDAFGLSRLASSRIKTVPQGTQSIFSTLSVDQAETTLALYDAARQEIQLFDFATLKRRQRIKKLSETLGVKISPEQTSILLHPEGGALCLWQDERYKTYEVLKDELETNEPKKGIVVFNEEANREVIHTFSFSGVPSSSNEPLHVGPPTPEGAEDSEPMLSPFSMGTEGVFLGYSIKDKVLFGGYWPTVGESPTLLWKLSVTINPRCYARLYASAKGSLLAVYDHNRCALHLLRIAQNGKYQLLELPGRGLPAWNGKALAYQSRVDMLVKLDWETQNAEDIPLPLSVIGVGQVMLKGEALFFLTERGDLLFDTKAKKVRPRRLPAWEEKLQTFFFTRSKHYETLGKTGGMVVHLDHLQCKERKNGTHLNYQVSLSGEAHRLLQVLAYQTASQNLYRELEEHTEKLPLVCEQTSVRSFLSYHSFLHSADEAEQREVFQHLLSSELKLLDLVPTLKELFDMRKGYDYPGASVPINEPGKPLFPWGSTGVWIKSLLLALKDNQAGVAYGLTADSAFVTLSVQDFQQEFFEALSQSPMPEVEKAFGMILRLGKELFEEKLAGVIVDLLSPEAPPLSKRCFFDLSVVALRLARETSEVASTLQEAFDTWCEKCESIELLWMVEQIVGVPERLKKYTPKKSKSKK